MLVERNPLKISLSEVLLYAWFAAFFYDELSEWSDAGSIFYAADVSPPSNYGHCFFHMHSVLTETQVWNLFDITMICIGFVFAVMRTLKRPTLVRSTLDLIISIGIVGLSTHNKALIEESFDILALEALFMVPRVCSILSLSPYWGTLIPCLKEMGKDFIKFVAPSLYLEMLIY